MKNHFLFSVIFFLSFYSVLEGQAGTAVLSGYVRDSMTREALPYATLAIVGGSTGVETNSYGFFSLEVPADFPVELMVRSLGYRPFTLRVEKPNVGTLNVNMQPDELMLGLVEVSAERELAFSGGYQRVTVEALRRTPLLLGEPDAIKFLQLQAGVQRGNEGDNGLYVRGGGGDQNLILLDGVPVYNAYHLFGLFSAVSGDAARQIDFYKGGFPARYGGRLSSVVDVLLREGRRDEWRAEGGLGIVSSRLTLEGPMLKGKGSLLFSGRRSYWDAVISPFEERFDDRRSHRIFHFQDLTIKAAYDWSSRDHLYVSFYAGGDRYGFAERSRSVREKSTLGWGNYTLSSRWTRQQTERMFIQHTLAFTRYQYSINARRQALTGAPFKKSVRSSSAIYDASLYSQWNYTLPGNVQAQAGLQNTLHSFRPNRIEQESFGASRLEVGAVDTTSRYAALAGAAFTSLKGRVGKLLYQPGLRYSYYLGGAGAAYSNLEPRLRLSTSKGGRELFVAYDRMAQYLHQLRSSGLGLPTDVWLPSTRRFRPQTAHQISLGTSQLLGQKGKYELIAETYYKNMKGVTDYRDGTGFQSIDLDAPKPKVLDWETLLVQGTGYSLGTEVTVSKSTGKLIGQATYSWAYTRRQFDDINGGAPFFPVFDRRHSVNLNMAWQYSSRAKLACNWVFASGNPQVLPLSFYDAINPVTGEISSVVEYGRRDSWRTRPYHRLDVSWQRTRNKKRWSYYWDIGAYNAYSRLNPTFFALDIKENKMASTQRAVFSQYAFFTIIPYISINFSIP